MFNPQTLSVCPEIAKLDSLPKKVTALATSIGRTGHFEMTVVQANVGIHP